MASSSSRFRDKVVMVTGGSRGIGAAIASAFSREGAQVLNVARTAEEHERIVAIPFDLGAASVKALNGLVADAVLQYGKLDVLVNNAGIIRRAPAVDFSPQDWDDVLNVILRSPFFLTQAVAKWWINGGGREKAKPADRLKIVNIASMLSYQGGITVPAYAASKHGIAGITKALANEWANQRINVNAIAPGYIATENTRALREDANRNTAILARIPQAYWGEPDEIAGGCLFLA